MPKPGRIPNRTKCSDPFASQIFQWLRNTVAVQNAARCMGNLTPPSSRRYLRYSASDNFAVGGGDRIGATQADDVGTFQSSKRFAQSAAREDVFETERLQRVEEYDIQVPREPTVLETVVENEEIWPELFDCPPCRRDSVAILDMWHIRQGLRQLAGLVV